MSISLQIIEEKNRILKNMREEVADCTRCPQLCASRHQTVFGEGNSNARIFFIGEAAGREEDKQGKPFVGRSGQLLDNILKACEWQRGDVFVSNLIKCRPPGNRVPKPEEIGNCSGYLEKQIEVVDPDYIVCLGSVASSFIVGMPVNQARGKWHSYKRHKVLCTYHPAFLLRNQEAKKLVWEDLQLLFKDMRR